MFIRSQDKSVISDMNACTIEVYGEENGIRLRGNNLSQSLYIWNLGEYSSKEKAIKVLDMICERLNDPIYINDLGGGEYEKYQHKVFQMPQDDEVE